VDDADRRRFLRQLEQSLEQYGVVLYAYCLMGNHYHLLVETPRGNVSRFMQRLNTAYGMYFRNRHRRPGHVLQGRYGGKLVEGDEYLLRVTRYIHLNPVKIKRVMKLPVKERLRILGQHRWSSYPGYVKMKNEEKMVDYRWRALVGGRGQKAERTRYRGYVESLVAESDTVLLEAMRQSRYAIGDAEFVEGVEAEMRRRRRQDERDRDVAWPEEGAVEIEAIKEQVAAAYGCAVSDLARHGRAIGEPKRVAIELACRLTDKSYRAVGLAFGGLSGAAVGQNRARLAEQMASDASLRKRLVRLANSVSAP
jgi:putative transposase